jgi:hypothetical protein
VAKSSGDHTPLGGFVFSSARFKIRSQIMVTMTFPITLAIISAGLAAAFYALFVRFGRDWNIR